MIWPLMIRPSRTAQHYPEIRKPFPSAAITSFASCESGVSAIEFAIVGPVFTAALLAMAVLAHNIYSRMMIDQIVRAGEAIAITDPGDQEVLKRMKAIAGVKGYLVSENPTGGGDDQLSLQAARTCFCPGSPNAIIGCNTICASGRPVVVRYHLAASYSSAFEYRTFWAVFENLNAYAFPVSDVYITRNVAVR